MKVATWGSKICDDALKYSKIENMCRIVEISPFSILTEHFETMQHINCSWNFYDNNDYLNRMINLDYSKQIFKYILSVNCEYIILSLDSMRLFLREFVFSDGTVFRLCENNVLIKHLEEIRIQIEKDLGLKIVRERVIYPLNYDEQILKSEIKAVCDFLQQKIDIRKLILLKTHNVYEYINKDNKIVSKLDIVEVVNKQNDFYDKCVHIFSEYINCQIIECPQLLIGDSRKSEFNMFHFTSIYYEYINKCLYAIEREEFSKERAQEILAEYMCKQKLEIDEIIMKPIIDLAYYRKKGRKIVLVGRSEVFLYNLKKRYATSVDLIIDYGKDASIEKIENELEKIKYRASEYLCIVPEIEGNIPILKILWKYGYGYNSGYLCNIHEPIILKEFQGTYEDVYNNKVIAKRKLNLELRGIGNYISLEMGKSYSKRAINILSQTFIEIEEGVEIEGDGFSSTVYDGAILRIGKGTILGDKVHIRCSFFTETMVGKCCEIGEDAILFNGDGHSIFDLHTGKNINYDLNNSAEHKHRIIIEDEVCIGENCFILSGSSIAQGSIVRDNAFLNKKFVSQGILSGIPANEERGIEYEYK